MKRVPFGWILFVLSLVTLAGIYIVYFPVEVSKMRQMEQFQKCPSDIYLRMLVKYDSPPIYEEEYRMQDLNGVSSASYRVRGYAGKEITVSAPARQEVDVSFFFGKLVQDDIWDLVNRPDAGDTNAHYTLYVKQLIDCKQGDRTITFTDPHYWAVAAGHQFHIDLSKNTVKNIGDLLRLKSTSTADPRYETIVNDFRAFGSDAFRRDIANAQATVRAAK
jgi:hypothetical protein